ncbi:MAG TPA: hypothetical protein VG942_17860 [Hyphomonadaceae bacterium]|nr:hypothetical protein [Hyphomonadaceae bacterium]
MKKILIIAALAACAAPAFADTLKEVTTKGIILTIEQIGAIDITYKPDGTFVGKNETLEGAIGGPLTGKWRIDGDKLCTEADIQPGETCTAYPKDKKSGDEFEITGDQGAVKIKIK